MTILTAGLLLSGMAGAVVASLLGRRRRVWRIVAACAIALVASLALMGGGYSYWYHHRAQPVPLHETLFEGVTYTREIRADPRPMVVHVVAIDLDAAGIGFLVTPGQPTRGHQLKARTTSQFLAEFRCQVAVNGDFFRPWHARGPFDYYPHTGDPVDVLGLAVSRGKQYAPSRARHAALAITSDNKARIGLGIADAHNAVSGGTVFVDRGEAKPGATAADKAHPRTAVALDASGRRLLLVVVDGRQPNYSEGATMPELAQIVLEHGGHTALNLDGGGSSTLVVEGPDGQPRVLNSPIHGRVPPGVERPVANHLGAFASHKR